MDLAKFLQTYEEKKQGKIPENILEKANYYKNTYTCFNTFYDPKMIWEKKKFIKKENKPIKNRFHIIIPDFTDSSITKRQLTGYLNKLTAKNKETIYVKIREIINKNNTDEYFQLIWSYIKAADDDLYFNVLHFFDQKFFEKTIDMLWTSYIEKKEWMPPDYIMNNNLLCLNDEYDMYCDYVKWKKGVNNIHLAWIKLQKNIDRLLEDIFNTMIQYINKEMHYENTFKYVIDIFLEQISKILKHHCNQSIIDKIRALDVTTFDNSSRFLIYSIIEKK